MNLFKRFLTTLPAACLFSCAGFSQQVQPLYEKGIPNSRNAPDREKKGEYQGEEILTNVSQPTLTVYLPAKEKATGTAVIVCPGGAYYFLAMGHEGTAIATALAEKGIAAFVLKYRLPDKRTMVDKKTGPFQDAQRALQLVRERAAVAENIEELAEQGPFRKT